MKLNEEQVRTFAAELTEPMFIIKEQIFTVLAVMRKLHGAGIAPESPLMQELDSVDIKLDTAYRQIGHTVCQMVQDDDYLAELYNKLDPAACASDQSAEEEDDDTLSNPLLDAIFGDDVSAA